MLQARIPRISTRGYYDLATGKTLKKKSYDLYPKRFFKELGNYPEFTIVVHGMRNNKQGALEKFKIAKRRLQQLGYKYPVVGFSYDSNVKGVQYKFNEDNAVKIGRIIARKNGNDLARFILDFKKKYPHTKIQLMGHSLGSEVILTALTKINKKDFVDVVYFFGSSINANILKSRKIRKAIQKTIHKKLVNYYSHNDDVLKQICASNAIEKPLGYSGYFGKPVEKFIQKKILVKDHRFLSYIKTLKSFAV